jgi:hypothetical protein
MSEETTAQVCNRTEPQLPDREQVAPIFHLLGDGQLEPEAVETLVAVLEAEGLPAVPVAQLIRAEEIPGRARWAARLATVRRLVGALVYDSHWPASLVGVRGVSSDCHRLLFTVDQWEVVVSETPGSRPGARNVVGQLLWRGDPISQASVVLSEPSRDSDSEADVDREGCFRLSDIVPGGYRLDILVPDGVIVCAPVAIG